MSCLASRYTGRMRADARAYDRFQHHFNLVFFCYPPPQHETLSCTVGKTFCKILNDRMETMLEKDENISKGQAGFRPKRSCVDAVYTLGKLIQGRKRRRANDVLFLHGCTEGL